jgi:hypothetical protein
MVTKNKNPNSKYDELAQQIGQWSRHWQALMGLDHFNISHVFLDSFFGDDGEEDFKVTATTEVRWNYLEAKIKWYLPSAIRHDEEHLKGILVHELCHVLLAAEQGLIDTKLSLKAEESMTAGEYEVLQEMFYERMELATEQVARVIYSLTR